MVDLRRYLPNGEAAGFANMASMIETQCGNFGDFLLTAKEVGRQMAEKKSRAPGLAGLPLLSLLNRVLPHALFAKLVKGVVKYPEISISNLGLLPPDLNFNNIPLREACVLTALKYAPSFQLSFSTHKDTLTLGVALLGTELDRKRAKDFLGILLNELSVG